jgi:hypothetical protein
VEISAKINSPFTDATLIPGDTYFDNEALLFLATSGRNDWLEMAMPGCPLIGLELGGMTSEGRHIDDHPSLLQL